MPLVYNASIIEAITQRSTEQVMMFIAIVGQTDRFKSDINIAEKRFHDISIRYWRQVFTFTESSCVLWIGCRKGEVERERRKCNIDWSENAVRNENAVDEDVWHGG